MCYPNPGPRCPTYAQQQLAAAEHAYQANPTLDTLTVREEARHQYNLTHTGIKALRQAGQHAEANHYLHLRNQQLNLYKQQLHAKASDPTTHLVELTKVATNKRYPLPVRQAAVVNLHQRHPVFSTFPLTAVKGMFLNPTMRAMNA